MPITLNIGAMRYKKANGEYDGFNSLGYPVDVLPTDGATAGQVPTADGDGSWEWATPSGGGGDVTDVQVNGVSVLDAQGVANVPIGGNLSNAPLGVVRAQNGLEGIYIDAGGYIGIAVSNDDEVKAGSETRKPVVPYRQHTATFYGLAKAAGADMKNISSTTVGVYPEAQKSAIQTMLNSPVSVTGTTPSITALSGIQYICGEVATLDITLPESGCIDVVFQSGSTATVLTVTPPTGVTVKWANGFDPDNLDDDTTYEINIKDGLGVGAAWA